jgi:hypothetical protein
MRGRSGTAWTGMRRPTYSARRHEKHVACAASAARPGAAITAAVKLSGEHREVTEQAQRVARTGQEGQ